MPGPLAASARRQVGEEPRAHDLFGGVHEDDGKTTVTSLIQYLTQEARDAAMQPGFEEGYEASYKQLDTLLNELRLDS